MTRKELVITAVLLIALSALVYWAHYGIFHDAHHIFIYLVGDVAFVPIEVLMVTLIIDRLLSQREKRSRQYKMNMVIGAFFSTAGTAIVQAMTELVPEESELHDELAIGPKWTPDDIETARAYVRGTRFDVEYDADAVGRISQLLSEHREFMVRLLENPILLERESFSELLWAAFHLGEELNARDDLAELPESDVAHLVNDIERAYTQLLDEWLEYMAHLQSDYPYLFSFAARTNPLREGARAVVA